MLTKSDDMLNKRRLVENGYWLYSEIAYRTPFGFAPLPPLIIWEISNKCNLKCAMCVLFGKNKIKQPKGKELSFEEVKSIIDDIRKTYRFLPFKPFIGLTGGEPFMRKDLIEILRYLKESGFMFSVTTNFSIPNEKMIKDMINSGLKDLRVSIDGPKEVHDSIRGIKVFDKVINNIRLIREDKKGRKLPIKINCTISKYNVDTITYMVNLADELKTDLSFQFVEFIDDKHFNAHKQFSIKKFGDYCPTKVDKEILTEDETNKIIARLSEAKKLARKKGVKLFFTPDIRNDNKLKRYFLDINGYRHSEKCTFPWSSARINSYGDMFPCIDYHYGNLRNHSFSESWNNKRARYFRKTLKKVGLFPGCIRCCKI